MAKTAEKRAFKYRFYPTDDQIAVLSRTFGCVRKVYNLALEARMSAWQAGRRMTFAETSAMLTTWKKTKDLAFLADVSSVPLQQALRHLDSAYVAFWAKRAQFPRFKSRKKSQSSAVYTRSGFRWRRGELTLARMSEPLAIRWSRPLPDGAHPSTVTVSCDRSGRWFVSMLVEDPGLVTLPPSGGAVGVDVGIETLATLSTSEKIANPRHEAARRRLLRRAQRSLARKQVGSANWEKARVKVARVHAQIVDGRNDFLHKLSTRLIRENQTVVVEDLVVRNMIKNRSLARSIADASWRKLRSMLEYKARWYGRNLIVIGRWYPSTRLCSGCGSLSKQLRLADRLWTCECGATHDRDINAAKNILAAGLAES